MAWFPFVGYVREVCAGRKVAFCLVFKLRGVKVIFFAFILDSSAADT